MSTKIWINLYVVRTPSGKFIIYEEYQDGFYRLVKFGDIDTICQHLRDFDIVETEIQKPDVEFTTAELEFEREILKERDNNFNI